MKLGIPPYKNERSLGPKDEDSSDRLRFWFRLYSWWLRWQWRWLCCTLGDSDDGGAFIRSQPNGDPSIVNLEKSRNLVPARSGKFTIIATEFCLVHWSASYEEWLPLFTVFTDVHRATLQTRWNLLNIREAGFRSEFWSILKLLILVLPICWKRRLLHWIYHV